MATIERVQPAYPAWTPSSPGIATGDEVYVGKHRKPHTWRALSLSRLFYVARHRVR